MRIPNSSIDKARAHNRRLAKQSLALSKDHVERIKSHPSTKEIRYPEFKESFDYVDAIFPNAKVKEALIYQVSKDFLGELGYKNVGGFFNKASKIVAVPDSLYIQKPEKYSIWRTISAEITFDEVIVHELIHYASDKTVLSNSDDFEEEVAYGNSLAYLRSKGYSDEFIIEKNFLPYLISSIDLIDVTRRVLVENGYNLHEFERQTDRRRRAAIKKVQKHIFNKTKSEAIHKGQELIRIYSETPDSKPVDQKISRVDLIDF